MKIEIEFDTEEVDIDELSDVLDEIASILPIEPSTIPQYVKANYIRVINEDNKKLYELKKLPKKIITKSGIIITPMGGC